MNKIKIMLLTLSLILGVAGTCMFAPYQSELYSDRSDEVAWWSGLYPEYCMPGATYLVGEEPQAANQEDIPVKIRFKYLTFLNGAES